MGLFKSPPVGMFYHAPDSGAFGKVVKRLAYSNHFLCEELTTAMQTSTGDKVTVLASRIVYIDEMKRWILYTRKEAKRVALRTKNGEQG